MFICIRNIVTNGEGSERMLFSSSICYYTETISLIDKYVPFFSKDTEWPNWSKCEYIIIMEDGEIVE